MYIIFINIVKIVLKKEVRSSGGVRSDLIVIAPHWLPVQKFLNKSSQMRHPQRAWHEVCVLILDSNLIYFPPS